MITMTNKILKHGQVQGIMLGTQYR